MKDENEQALVFERARAGDPHALGELLIKHQERLLRIVSFRIDPRLRVKVDPADVIQEAFVDATRRFAEYSQAPEMPFFLWLRFLTMQKLAEIHRRHFGVKARDAKRELSLFDGPSPQTSSAVLAAQLLGKLTSPSEAAMRVELKLRLEEKLNEMEPLDREILVLRHFEQLGNGEAAKILGIGESAASSRYVRAIKRLKDALTD